MFFLQNFWRTNLSNDPGDSGNFCNFSAIPVNISKMRLKLFWKCVGGNRGEMDKDKLGVSLSLARFANTSWNWSIAQEMRHWKQGLCSTEEANNK